MKRMFLDPDRQIPGIDVVFSVRSEGAHGPLHARDFYNAWLHLWPLGLGSLIHYAEEAPVYHNLRKCLNQRVACSATCPFRDDRLFQAPLSA